MTLRFWLGGRSGDGTTITCRSSEVGKFGGERISFDGEVGGAVGPPEAQ